MAYIALEKLINNLHKLEWIINLNALY
jgi:hypothetical protein